jgi:DNA-directed RNA polymerase subunit RPC12/RpoP
VTTEPIDQQPLGRTSVVRLPLQVGLAGLGQATRFAALVWLGPILLLASAMFAPMFSTLLRLPWMMVTGLGSLFALASALEAAERAKRDRPSDVLLSTSGLEVDGNREAARKLAWTQVYAEKCEIVADEPRLAVRWLVLSWLTLRKVPSLVARERVPVCRLRLPLRASGHVDLAEAEGDERASLEALRDSIRSAGAPQTETAAPPLPPEILRCSNCGAPQVPVDQESAPCPFCGHGVSMPEALRQKLRAVGELRADDVASTRLVARLLSQPTARSAARLLWLGRKLLVWVQPAALVYLCVLVYHQTEARSSSDGPYVARVSPGDDPVFFYDLAALAAVIAVAFLVVWSALAAYFANRNALRVLAESFGAVPPTKPGVPSTCRLCGAPLPGTAAELLVRCVYCSAQNVLGVDPRPAAARQRRQHGDLQASFASRRRARIRLALTVPVCALLGAATVREAALIWWVPVLDSSASCSYGHCGTIENRDRIRRTFSIADDTTRVRGTVLPGGTIFWSCTADCKIAAGSGRASTSDLSTPSTLLIAHGSLQSATGARIEPHEDTE